MDPRGVGLSTPIKCDPNLWNQRTSIFPTTEEEYDSLVAHNKALGESCAKLTGNLINHLDTVHVVEDFELFRRAINSGSNEGLNFLGVSYGTQIGVQYAEKYPENINRFVLDGVLDHSLPETTTLTVESQTYEATLNQFFSWCNTTSDCALQGQDAASLFDNLVRKAIQSPIPAPGCSSTGDSACFFNVTDEDILANTQDFLASFNSTQGWSVLVGWPALALALAQTAQGNATLFSTRIATSDTFSSYPTLVIGYQD